MNSTTHIDPKSINFLSKQCKSINCTLCNKRKTKKLKVKTEEIKKIKPFDIQGRSEIEDFIKQKIYCEKTLIFRCPFCKNIHLTKEAFKQHLRTKHIILKSLHYDKQTNSGFFICPFEDCSKKVRTQKAMQKHIRTHITTPRFLSSKLCFCPFNNCKITFSAETFKEHITTFHRKQDLLKCPWDNCEKRFKRPYRFAFHALIIH